MGGNGGAEGRRSGGAEGRRDVDAEGEKERGRERARRLETGARGERRTEEPGAAGDGERDKWRQSLR